MIPARNHRRRDPQSCARAAISRTGCCSAASEAGALTVALLLLLRDPLTGWSALGQHCDKAFKSQVSIMAKSAESRRGVRTRRSMPARIPSSPRPGAQGARGRVGVHARSPPASTPASTSRRGRGRRRRCATWSPACRDRAGHQSDASWGFERLMKACVGTTLPAATWQHCKDPAKCNRNVKAECQHSLAVTAQRSCRY